MSNTGKTKVESTGRLEGAQAHIKTSDNGPTGSSRSYPKGSGVKHNTNWNPIKMAGSKYGINGV
jgi:hypothetical protein